MLQQTKQAISAILATDQTIDADKRKMLMAGMEDAGKFNNPAAAVRPIGRLVTWKEAEKLTGRTARRLRAFVGVPGGLVAIRYPGSSRDSGVTEESIRRLLAGRNKEAVA